MCLRSIRIHLLWETRSDSISPGFSARMCCPSFFCSSTQKCGYRFMAAFMGRRGTSEAVRSRMRTLSPSGFSLRVVYRERSSVNSFCSVDSSADSGFGPKLTKGIRPVPFLFCRQKRVKCHVCKAAGLPSCSVSSRRHPEKASAPVSHETLPEGGGTEGKQAEGITEQAESRSCHEPSGRAAAPSA